MPPACPPPHPASPALSPSRQLGKINALLQLGPYAIFTLCGAAWLGAKGPGDTFSRAPLLFLAVHGVMYAFMVVRTGCSTHTRAGAARTSVVTAAVRARARARSAQSRFIVAHMSKSAPPTEVPVLVPFALLAANAHMLWCVLAAMPAAPAPNRKPSVEATSSRVVQACHPPALPASPSPTP